MYRLAIVTVLGLAFSLTSGQLESADQVLKKGYNPTGKPLPKSIPRGFQGRARIDPNAAAALEATSHAAFMRSLMPLEDYLTYLGMARDARLSGKELTEAEVVAAWTHYRDQLRQIVPTLQRLNQPAASNWAAELAWSKYAVLRADLSIAQITEDDSAAANLREQLQSASAALLTQRQFDYQLGMASLSDLAYARDRFLATNGSNLSDRVELLSGQKAVLESWRQAGAEIGRADKIVETQLSQELLQFQGALSSGDFEMIHSSLKRVNEVSHAHFDQTMAYYQRGTAPLHQLTKSLTLRQRLNRLEEEIPELVDDESKQRFDQDWSQLKRIAAAQQDRRGRISADLLAVELLGMSIEPASE